jgi:hypothetical protein
MVRGQAPRRLPVLVLATLAVVTLDGCVKRRYTIRTDPPGVLAFVNGAEVGATPVSKSFTYYGTREILLVSPDGTQKRVLQDVDAPWWDNAVTDFVSENLLPFTLRDEREFKYTIEPSPNTPKADLLARAQALRQEAQGPIPPRKRKGFFWWVPTFGLF